ncbi:MAG: SDR family oxidoreductase [Luteitalea sp.]|nr:SDR family oxidoreductase [Luteitalea sp.]
MNPHALDGRVVVVIGGTTGLGLAGVMACLRVGARVVTIGLDEASVAAVREQLGARGEAVAADARDPDTAPAAIAQAIERFGRFDALYHVAGGSGRAAGDGPIDAMTDEGWHATMALNVTSVAWSNRAALRAFLQRGHGGSILNLTSVLAWAPSPCHFATHAYAAAKAGIIGLTRACAARYAPAGIRVNALAPGLVETPMARRAAEDGTIMSVVRQRQALGGGRIGHPTDLDEAVVFFLSDRSGFTTGQVLAIDGGWTVRDAVEDS